MNDTRCVLAYSGGLDTSAIVPWLIDQGYEVHAVLVDVGQDEAMEALRDKALRFGAESAVIRDAKAAMFDGVVPFAIGLAATYEGNYRLGTALARPFIAAEQVRRAQELGGATLVHGATGKGNDQIRFEYAYKSLAPGYPILAPWKVWPFRGRADLIGYLQSKGVRDDFAVTKEFSFDENLWHLSVEGGPLENPAGALDIDAVLKHVSDRFAGGVRKDKAPRMVRIGFDRGVPIEIDGAATPLPAMIEQLNRTFRAAPWAWDLVIENRFTGIKSRGVYINPAAKLLHLAIDALARCVLNKSSYDYWTRLGQEYGTLIYRGEYFTDQRRALEAAGRSLMLLLTGEVLLDLRNVPYAAQIQAPRGLFRESLATFQHSQFDHSDADGFIRLTWLSSVGRPVSEAAHEDALEPTGGVTSDLCATESVPGGGLVPATV